MLPCSCYCWLIGLAAACCSESAAAKHTRFCPYEPFSRCAGHIAFCRSLHLNRQRQTSSPRQILWQAVSKRAFHITWEKIGTCASCSNSISFGICRTHSCERACMHSCVSRQEHASYEYVNCQFGFHVKRGSSKYACGAIETEPGDSTSTAVAVTAPLWGWGGSERRPPTAASPLSQPPCLPLSACTLI